MMAEISLASLRILPVSHAGAFPMWSGKFAMPVLCMVVVISWLLGYFSVFALFVFVLLVRLRSAARCSL
jgi:hypothetical protein